MKRIARRVVAAALVLGLSQALSGCGAVALYCVEKQDRNAPCDWF